MTTRYVINPDTGRSVCIGGKSYKRLVREGKLENAPHEKPVKQQIKEKQKKEEKKAAPAKAATKRVPPVRKSKQQKEEEMIKKEVDEIKKDPSSEPVLTLTKEDIKEAVRERFAKSK